MDTELQDKVSVTNGFSFAIDEESQFTQMLDTQGYVLFNFTVKCFALIIKCGTLVIK